MARPPWTIVHLFALAALSSSGCGQGDGAAPAETSDAAVATTTEGGARDAAMPRGEAGVSAEGGASLAAAVNRVASSASHSCSLRQAGLYCWGDNTSGQLGTGDTQEYRKPVAAKVAGSDIVEIAATSGRTCVRRAAGAVACWGGNEYGQLGNASRVAATAAVTVDGIANARQLALNEESSCVLRGDGTVACWGGALEDDSALLRPQEIAGAPKLLEISRGGQTAYCGRDAEGAVWCWSHDWKNWSAARKVALDGAKALAMTGLDEICALVQSSEIVCHNLDNGHLIPLDESSGSLRVASGPLVACGQRSDRSWRCWNVLPPMLEETGSGPIPLVSDLPLVELSVAGLSGCALREDGKVSCLSVNALLPTWVVVDDLPE